MSMTIAERLRPYSHTPGTYSLLPGSFYRFQIFPCLIRVHDLTQADPILVTEIHLALPGLMRDFTIQVDLEKGRIIVWGHTSIGFFRYHLISDANGRGWSLYAEKVPSIGLEIIADNNTWKLQSKESALFGVQTFTPYLPPVQDRLSLGNHKAQDWDLVCRRLDLKEIFPMWNRLAQLIPALPPPSSIEGTLTLLADCQQVLLDNQSEQIVPSFEKAFKASFQGILSPRLWDDDYQGLLPIRAIQNQHLSPLSLMAEGQQLIRHLFIEQQENEITLLPHLPPEFHCGRFLRVAVKGGVLDLEWSKKVIRRLIFYASEDQEITWHFKKNIKYYRLRHSYQTKGMQLQAGDSSLFKKNCYYFLDNFI